MVLKKPYSWYGWAAIAGLLDPTQSLSSLDFLKLLELFLSLSEQLKTCGSNAGSIKYSPTPIITHSFGVGSLGVSVVSLIFLSVPMP